MRLVTITLEEAERVLLERRQNYTRPEGMEIVKVHALKDDEGNIRGVSIWGRLNETTAKRVHIYSDASPMGFTMLYGQACRALGSDGFTTVML